MRIMKSLKNRKYKSGEVDGGLILILSCFSIVIIGFVCLGLHLSKETTEEALNAKDSYKKAYTAWVKQDGNSKNLTYDEWRSLIAVDSRLLLKE